LDAYDNGSEALFPGMETRVRWLAKPRALLPIGPYCGSGQTHIRKLVLSHGSVKLPADINNDHKVDIKDVFTAAKAFGKTY